MRKLFSAILLFLIVFGIILNTAEAARFGGGRSFGTQRSFSGFSRLQQPARIQPQNLSANRWLAPLAGLAAGGLLAYLFMGHGLGSGLLSWLAIIGIASFIWSFLRSKLQPAASSTPYNNNAFRGNDNVLDARSHFTQNNARFTENKASPYPIGFDPEAFLREAKVQFIRLQAAYDAKDLNDLREFTAPEVFAEIQLQLQERGEAVNKTEVVSLNANLLNAASEFQATVASVEFSGMIKEIVTEPAASFRETWHFRRDRNNWLVTGVQQ